MFHLYKGSYEIHENPEPLKSIPVTPRGQRSQRWQGVPHYDFVTTIHSVLKRLFDLYPQREQYAVSPNGAVLLGGFELVDSHGQPLRGPDELQNGIIYSMGFRHGNDSSRAVECSAGASVSVCENGMLTGEDRWRHKHTTGLRLFEFIKGGLKGFLDKIKEAGKRALNLQYSAVDPNDTMHDTGLLYLARKGILPWRLIEHVDANWRLSGDQSDDPFHPRNWWSWYNIVTDVAKRLPISQQYDALNRAFLLSEGLAGVRGWSEVEKALRDKPPHDYRNWALATGE